MTLSSPSPLSNANHDEQPNGVFVHAFCSQCFVKWAICIDMQNPASGNVWFFDSMYTPTFPPRFSMSANDKIICPTCIIDLELKSRWAVLTSSGKWLYLDNTEGTDGVVARLG